jgi:hypothetical protein
MQAIIDTVIDGMDLLAEGKEWPEEDAKAAANAADETVWPAYWAATAAYDRGASDTDWAAKAAANAADGINDDAALGPLAARFAACRRQRDLLLNLIKAAPITQQQQQQDN